jgi:hypothetical protein
MMLASNGRFSLYHQMSLANGHGPTISSPRNNGDSQPLLNDNINASMETMTWIHHLLNAHECILMTAIVEVTNITTTHPPDTPMLMDIMVIMECNNTNVLSRLNHMDHNHTNLLTRLDNMTGRLDEAMNNYCILLGLVNVTLTSLHSKAGSRLGALVGRESPKSQVSNFRNLVDEMGISQFLDLFREHCSFLEDDRGDFLVTFPRFVQNADSRLAFWF